MENFLWKEGEEWEVSFIELAIAFTLQTGIVITDATNDANK